MHINELRDKAAGLLARQEELLNRKHADGDTSMTAEESAEFDTIESELRGVEVEIDRTAKLEARKSSMLQKAVEERIEPEAIESDDSETRAAAHAAAFDKYLRFGENSLNDAEKTALTTETRANLGAGSPLTVTTTAGGYTIPVGFQDELSQALKAYGGVRQAARILNTPTGNDLHWPTMDDTASVGELLAINTTAADGPVAFGEVVLKAYKFSSKGVVVPIELAQDSAFDLGALLSEQFSIRIGRITNTYFTTGTGSAQPKGVVAAAYSNVTSEAATGVTYNDLVNLEHSVDPAYRPGASWMFADSTLKVIKKLKDANGIPLWQPSISQTSPASILGYPYVINQDMAAATTGQKSVLFGDFKSFVVRDVMGIQVLRLVERFAEIGQVAYLAFSRHDSNSIAAESNNGALRYLLQA